MKTILIVATLLVRPGRIEVWWLESPRIFRITAMGAGFGRVRRF